MATGTAFNTSTMDWTNAPNYCHVEWSYEQSITSNSTDISYTVTLGTNVNGYVYLYSRSITLMDGNGNTIATKSSTTRAQYTTSGGVGQTIFTGTATLPHNDDGTASVHFVLSIGMTSNSKKSTADRTFTLPTIARASSVALSASSLTIGSTNLTVTATSKANFYHRLTWSLGGSTTTVWTAQNINATSRTATISYTSMLSKLTTATSGTLTVTLTTYSDSAGTTTVGSATASCAVSINTSTYKPTLSLGAFTFTDTSPLNVLVAGYSSASLTATVSNSAGLSSSAYTLTATATHGTPSVSGTTISSGTLPASATDYTYTLTVTVRDTRGVSTTATKSTTVKGYQLPNITGSFYRVASSGSTTADEAGTYVYGTYSATATAIGNNAMQSTTCAYTGTSSGSIASGGYVALAENGSLTFTVTATDKVASTTKSFTVSTAVFPIDLYQSGSNVGVAFGGVASSGYAKFNDLQITTNKSAIAGNATDTTEHYVMARSNSGSIYIDSVGNADGDGNRGLYAGAHGTGSGKWAVRVDTDNNVTLNGNATSASNARVTLTNPTTASTYFPLWVSNYTEGVVYSMRVNNGLRYATVEGGSSSGVTTGYGMLVVGNSTATGTDGNKRGYVRIFSSNTSYVQLNAASTTSACTLTLPARNGETVATTADIPSNTTSDSVITRTSGGTISSQHAVKYGNVVTLYATIAVSAFSASTSTVNDFFVGSVASEWRPSYNATGASYIGFNTAGISVTSSGVLTVRKASTTASSAGSISFSLTYVIG